MSEQMEKAVLPGSLEGKSLEALNALAQQMASALAAAQSAAGSGQNAPKTSSGGSGSCGPKK